MQTYYALLFTFHLILAFKSARVARSCAVWVECYREFAGALLLTFTGLLMCVMSILVIRESQSDPSLMQIGWMVVNTFIACVCWMALDLLRRRLV